MVGCSFSSKLVLGQEKHSGDECHTLLPIFRLNTIGHQIVFPWNTDVTVGAIPLASPRYTKKCRSGHRANFGIRLAHRCHDGFQPHIVSQVFT